MQQETLTERSSNAADAVAAPSVITRQLCKQVSAGRPASKGASPPMILETATPSNLLWPGRRRLPRGEDDVMSGPDMTSALQALGHDLQRFLVDPQVATTQLQTDPLTCAAKAVGFLVGHTPLIVILQAENKASVKAISLQIGLCCKACLHAAYYFLSFV